ncbi:hypothetical protein EKO27_g3367 [Xylaria grammica]|uniref:Pre-mRNA-splicing factor n=1 Tax=Xylaria grammica TaxID=363999 RepID=A0A439DBF0_9PEZI|nr:hypothetical protein EKO27_g3367 [Xylaria grammica]
MSDSVLQSKAPRIAIKFGASSSAGPKTSDNVNIRGQSQPSSTLGKRQRPNALYYDSESGEDDENTKGKHESVTTIGLNTTSRGDNAPTGKEYNKEYVISSQKNRGWKADVKKRRGDGNTVLHTSKNNDNLETAPADRDKDIKWGLNVTKKNAQYGSLSADNEHLEEEKDALRIKAELLQPPRDANRDAVDALLGKRNPQQHLVIKDPAVSRRPQFSEQDAYERSMTEAADVSTIEEYSEIPEGEFGAAMLRGMGWTGEEFGAKPKEAKRRPHLMGLGSKEDEEIKKAEFAKRHGHRERRPRLDEYRRDREKETQERNGRYRDSYKSERERERREHNYDHRLRAPYRERDDRGHR